MWMKNLNQTILSWPRPYKRAFVFLLDALFCILATEFAFYLRLSEWVSLFGSSLWNPGLVVLMSIIFSSPIFIWTGFYRAIFRYSEYVALQTIIKSIGIYTLLFAMTFSVIGCAGVPKTIGIIQPLILLLLVGGSRAFAGYWFGRAYRKIIKIDASSRALIYGAGYIGRQLCAALSANSNVRIMGYVDDDLSMKGGLIDGVNVYTPETIEELVQAFAITDVFLAIPSASQDKRNQILSRLRGLRVSVRKIPSTLDLVTGKLDLSQIQDLDLDDLLGRSPVLPDQNLISKNVKNKTILVTGAGGSIGSELCLQIFNTSPGVLLLVDNHEHALYQILTVLEGLKTKNPTSEIKIIPLLASIQDEIRMREIFRLWQPDLVFHAAAYKHVPMVEHNSLEGMRNNVLGTLLLTNLAIETQVSQFILVSTDKAVRPTNIMGASKRLAEMILLGHSGQFGSSHHTIFSMVRFGNVLGSSGSVIPRFREQIRAGGPLTLTHPKVTRFFMSVNEAVLLVLQAAGMARGGEVFLLDMGEPVQIKELAYRLIELSGHSPKDDEHPDGDIAIHLTGLRPGEKLFEELLIEGSPEETQHSRIKKSKELPPSWEEISGYLDRLEKIINANDPQALVIFLQEVIDGYVPNHEIVDWSYQYSLSKQKILN